ncbi:TPA: hypothetical protein U5E31_001949 [Yersinia enterocolitica]|uniref:hypothetical protein n=1 Tax=Yersinia enterocolitica TaxID=630 RepID=UPI00094BBA39|nr:hypothetical protein [Yersinia enterocolitica]MBW5832004.1 hypothetical protein [Yersinia enterocolitica]MBX9473838.1 hypothetical protein [Yersinia enterocolitica]MBX9488751.1 hypothetical protein [Yersinia enterocolitica]MBX9492745.1 hypothetical protein [Yersinia enterocolitica]HDL8052480.1 hypothetical protein [Yersinia enterocolitica]
MKKSLLATSVAVLFVVGTGFSTVTYACDGTHSQSVAQVIPGMGTLTPAIGTLTPHYIPMIPLEK